MFSKSMVSMLGLVAVVAGCSDVHTPVDASAISGGASRNAVSLAGKGEKPIGIEATFLAIADSAPGFGGVYIDKDGQTRMAVTTAANVPQVLSRVRQHYAGLAEEGYLNSVIPTIVPYNYRQLYTWKEALQAKLQDQQVAGSAIHVSTNTVDVFANTADGDNAALVAADTVWNSPGLMDT